MEWLKRFRGKKPDTQTETAQSFSQTNMRRAFQTRAGNQFFNKLNDHGQRRVSEVFASQDAEGLKQLVETYDAPTVEALALAMDDAVGSVIGEESSYHSWTSEAISGDVE